MRNLLHRIEHWLGWNTGEVVTWEAEDEFTVWEYQKIKVGFRCDDCGKIEGVHDAPEHIFPPYLRNRPKGAERES